MRLATYVAWNTLLLTPLYSVRGDVPDSLLAEAGDNRGEIERALVDVPEEQREGMEFLVRNMPLRDLRSLSADYLLENTRLAYLSWSTDRLAHDVPKAIFLNNLLPYASINERRDNWRNDFRNRFLSVVKHAKTRSEATTLLNKQIFAALHVKYSTARPKADQSPYESIEAGTASCTGLSILLIDACRAVGIPARFVGTPLWANKSGNHSWVEIWDDGWHFTGAAEPTGDQLNRGWFVTRAAAATPNNPAHAIYATSFLKTPLTFPCVWDLSISYIPAVNVTQRYIALKEELPAGHIEAQFVVRDHNGARVSTPLRIYLEEELVFAGRSKNEGYDANDHLRTSLKQHRTYTVEIGEGNRRRYESIQTSTNQELFAFPLSNVARLNDSPSTNSETAVESLRRYLATSPKERSRLDEQAFASVALSREEVNTARQLLATDRLAQVRKERAEAFETRVVKQGKLEMPFFYTRFGEEPPENTKAGSSLYISLHGGGGAPPAVNDRQWENQKHLYEIEEGIYLAPRAPTDTWDLWHQSHIDPLFSQLIEQMVAFEGVDWNRVYLMGYSAGGDGVYQLAPRMADRWAAAAMMAGHPNETSPLGLRNVPFHLQVGGRDAAYRRNQVATEWGGKLAALRTADPDGYDHVVKIHADKGHWMDGDDAVAIPWMAKRRRNPTPHKLVWKQDDVTHSHFYWLGVDAEQEQSGSEVTAEVDGQTIRLTASKIDELTVYLDDRFINLDLPIKIEAGNKLLYDAVVPRTIANLSATLSARRDPNLSFPSFVTVKILKTLPEALVPSAAIPRYDASRTADTLVIDGRLEEAAWKSASKTSSFVDLISGKKTDRETRSALLWDDEYLYIGFWVTEPNVDAKYRVRDAPVYYDNDVEVFIAGQDAYYEFEINAHATVYEGFFVWENAYRRGDYQADPQLRRGDAQGRPFNGVGFTTHPRGKRIAFLQYDFPNSQSAVHIEGTLNDDSDIDTGWTVELAFPWKEMASLARGDGRSLPPTPGDRWRIGLFRFNKYKTSADDAGGSALGMHTVWDSHIPELYPIVTFVD